MNSSNPDGSPFERSPPYMHPGRSRNMENGKKRDQIEGGQHEPIKKPSIRQAPCPHL
ncbi:hypothetical protein KIN20_017753 [Parelaphostrongylus tenuis]|uniref:Uncharacterized protein n=1 Tax=Parelaphostrongylus tenuis TaxID=148309 RepID=A0AAD5QRQ4_PARTN|nr:hypothetical protein KIN20_017753 [Parelaphostrongylus tenuis]